MADFRYSSAFTLKSGSLEQAPLVPAAIKAHLAQAVAPTGYDAYAAYVCAVASAWVYADLQTMTEVMARQGLGPNVCLRFNAKNDALFVVATADLVRSLDGSVGVLTFRGTEPTSIINWLTDFTMRPTTIPNRQGLVHGGMYRNLLAIWDDIVSALENAIAPGPVPSPLPAGPATVFFDGSDATKPTAVPASPLRALYVTGHSLGGAMAAFAAVRLLGEKPYAHLGRVVKGVYTFGQPLVADAEFVKSLQKEAPGVADMVYRHVFGDDIVPQLPSASMSRLVHFGPERRAAADISASGEERPSPWVPTDEVTTQLQGAFFPSLIAIGDYLKQQFTSLRNLSLPYSIENHIPGHYVLSSLLPGQQTEFSLPPAPPAPSTPAPAPRSAVVEQTT